MTSEILKALVTALGGEGEELFKEFDKFATEYPNLTLLVTDVVRNGAMLAQDVNELNNKVELLKDLLVEAGVVKSIKVSTSEDAPEMIKANKPPEEDEIRINDILWHHAVDDGDLPN